jgi:hypothetical protein
MICPSGRANVGAPAFRIWVASYSLLLHAIYQTSTFRVGQRNDAHIPSLSLKHGWTSLNRASLTSNRFVEKHLVHSQQRFHNHPQSGIAFHRRRDRASVTEGSFLLRWLGGHASPWQGTSDWHLVEQSFWKKYLAASCNKHITSNDMITSLGMLGAYAHTVRYSGVLREGLSAPV